MTTTEPKPGDPCYYRDCTGGTYIVNQRPLRSAQADLPVRILTVLVCSRCDRMPPGGL